jgi:ATP-dependent Clp protease adaptor protein ClpS
MSAKDSSPEPRSPLAPQSSLPTPDATGTSDAPGAPGPATAQERAPAADRRDLPPFRVLLHNDQHNDMVFVVESICDLTPLSAQRAAAVMMEAHRTGVAHMLTTHRERAELYVEQFQTRRLKVTMEPAE